MSVFYGAFTRDLRTLQSRLFSRNFSVSQAKRRIPSAPNLKNLASLLNDTLNKATEPPKSYAELQQDDSEEGRVTYRSRREQNKRPAKPKEPPFIPLPDWFLQRNVILHEDKGIKVSLQPALSQLQAATDEHSFNTLINSWFGPIHYHPQELPAKDEDGCSINLTVLIDLLLSIQGSILPGSLKTLPFTHACCTTPGGIDFLKSVIHGIGETVKADFVHITIQDIAELATHYSGALPEEMIHDFAKSLLQLENLAFQAYKPPSSEQLSSEEDNDNKFSIEIPGVHILNASSKSLSGFRRHASEDESEEWLSRRYHKESLSTPLMRSFLDSILHATAAKRTNPSNQKVPYYFSHSGTPLAKPVIICISDFSQIASTEYGNSLIVFLTSLVTQARSRGHEITIVGLSCLGESSKASWQQMEEDVCSEPLGACYRTTMVEPVLKETRLTNPGPFNMGKLINEAQWKTEWQKLQCIRIMEINLRRLSKSFDSSVDNGNLYRNIASSIVNDSRVENILVIQKLGDHVWTRGEVSAMSLMAKGLKILVKALKIPELEPATAVQSVAMLAFLIDLQNKDSKLKEERDKKATSDKLLGVPQADLSKHERSFLNGVVDPAAITTAFNQVHATPETIETLRTVTSLSLSRPDAFSYGILQKEHLPGLLLYGPPGTGKTLLAKAVAKESNAKVIMVSGGSIFDRYFGESERKISALFSLARKIAPSVIFIDEADALFVSRGGNGNQMHHFYTNIVNQFLREIEMHFHTPDPTRPVVLMVATNRPYAIDDAILRRLPRRILVDLPTEKDRLAILNILLADEQIADDVSVTGLAARTPLYSGSDLKSVVVAAALNAVREETAKGGPWEQKRVLKPEHFDLALGEISASISDDMDSLKELKKFDEKYGDRKGRKQKQVLGFGELDKAIVQNQASIRG
jgi:hypothetical protein